MKKQFCIQVKNIKEDNLEKTLKKFLEDKEQKILVIKGRWGVGKTYRWEGYVKSNEEWLAEHFPVYSYVSLFGKSTYLEMEKAIINNVYLLNEKKYKKIISSWKNKKRVIKKCLKNVFSNVYIQKYLWKEAAWLDDKIIPTQLICFDDIERKEKGLSIKTFMGYVDELAQQKKCKIIIIFNEEQLNDQIEEKNSFITYREKIVDLELVYNPSLSESLRNIFTEEELNKYPFIEELAIQLKIDNMRIFKKIKRSLNLIDEYLKDTDDLIANDIRKNLMFFSRFYYQMHLGLSFEFVKNNLSTVHLHSLLSTDNSKDDEESSKLEQLGNLMMGLKIQTLDLNDEIIFFLENGYFNPQKTEANIRVLSADKKQRDIIQQLDDLMDLYKYTYAPKNKFICEEMRKILYDKENYKYIRFADFLVRLSNLKFFEDLEGKTSSFEDYIDDYIEVNKNYLTENYKEIQRIFGFSNNRDNSIYQYANEPFDKLVPIDELVPDTLDSILTYFINHQAMNQDYEFFKTLTSDDIYQWLKSKKDIDIYLHSKIRKLAEITYYGHGGADIFDELLEALEKISNESSINKMRVEGIVQILIGAGLKLCITDDNKIQRCEE